MTQVTLMDKWKTLIDVTSTSPYFLGIIGLFILLTILFITTNKNNAKKSKIIYILVYVIALGVLIFKYGTSIKNLLDYLMNHLFIFFYFPNLAAYIVGILITNIILWKTLFGNKNNIVLKIVNSTAYCLLHYIMILILNVITTEKLDIFKETSVYQNKQALALIELSSTIFIVWILFIFFFRIIKKYQNRGQKKNQVETIEYVMRPQPITMVDAPSLVYQDQKQIIEETVEPVQERSIEDLVRPIEQIMPVEDVPFINEEPVIEPICDGDIIFPEVTSPLIGSIYTTDQSSPIIKNIETNKINSKDPVVASKEIFDSLFTLDDYKLLLNFLKQMRDAEKKEQEQIIIKPNKNSNLTELQQLY